MKTSTVLIVIGAAGAVFIGGRLLLPAVKPKEKTAAETLAEQIAATVKRVREMGGGVGADTADNTPEAPVATTYGDRDSDATPTATSAQTAPSRTGAYAEEVLMEWRGGASVLTGL